MLRIREAALICGCLWILVSPAANAQDEVRQYPRGWYLGMQMEAQRQIEMLNIAYDLDEGQTQGLTNELEGRIKEQWAYMQAPPPNVPNGSTPESVEGREDEVLAAIQDFYTNMPMNPDRVADWLESNFLAPGQAPLGRMKLTEMRYREYQRNSIKTDDPETKIKISRELKMRRGRSIASSNASGQWLPAGVRTASRGDDRSVRWHVAGAGSPTVPARDDSVGQPATGMDLQPLPCLDPWRETARQICRRASVENPAAVASLWSEVLMRAWRRIAMDADAFNEVQNATSNSRVSEILKDRGIQPDLDALFLEFQSRLEALEAGCNS